MFHCLNNAYIDNETHSPPNIHVIFDKVHRDNACDIQKTSTERRQITVHPWFIGGITEAL